MIQENDISISFNMQFVLNALGGKEENVHPFQGSSGVLSCESWNVAHDWCDVHGQELTVGYALIDSRDSVIAIPQYFAYNKLEDTWMILATEHMDNGIFVEDQIILAHFMTSGHFPKPVLYQKQKVVDGTR